MKWLIGDNIKDIIKIVFDVFFEELSKVYLQQFKFKIN